VSLSFLDTDACIDYLRGRSPGVRRRLLESSRGEVAVAAMVRAELLYGARKSARVDQNLAAVEQFLRPLRVVPFDAAAATVYASIRAALEGAGLPIGPNDLVIAATAMAAGGRLVTRNVGEFGRVTGLVLEDWT
jgi:tRNA(fMet)-specific endonuclease VapC